jgi:hypothetical protein
MEPRLALNYGPPAYVSEVQELKSRAVTSGSSTTFLRNQSQGVPEFVAQIVLSTCLVHVSLGQKDGRLVI